MPTLVRDNLQKSTFTPDLIADSILSFAIFVAFARSIKCSSFILRAGSGPFSKRELNKQR